MTSSSLWADFAHPLDWASAYITGGRTPAEVQAVADQQNAITMRQLSDGTLTPVAATTYFTTEAAPANDQANIATSLGDDFNIAWNQGMNNTLSFLKDDVWGTLAQLPTATGQVVSEDANAAVNFVGKVFDKVAKPTVDVTHNIAIAAVGIAAIYFLFLTGPAVRAGSRRAARYL